jgi:hypothetical protein
MLDAGSRTAYKRPGIRMNVEAAVHPVPPPRGVVDEYLVSTPSEVGMRPPKGSKGRANHHRRAEPNGTTYEKARPRRSKHDARIVDWNIDVGGINRQAAERKPKRGRSSAGSLSSRAKTFVIALNLLME